MKYMISWFERPQGSPAEHEECSGSESWMCLGQCEAPANFKIELFVVRVGEWGGHMLVDCDDPLTVHKFCSTLPAFVFEARPVVLVADAVRVELAHRLARGSERKVTAILDKGASGSCAPSPPTGRPNERVSPAP